MMTRNRSMSSTNNRRKATLKVSGKICLTILLLGSGCANVTPYTVTPDVTGFDGNVQNGGIVGELPNKAGWEITFDALNRYNSYISRYGRLMSPPIDLNYGTAQLADGNYSLTYEGAEKWERMILLHHRTLQRQAISK